LKINDMKKLYFALYFTFVITSTVSAQSIGIGATIFTPSDCSILDMSTTTNKGILIPNLALTALTTYAPATGTAKIGLLIYNTATVAGITPGYYYWDGSKWVRILSGSTCNTLDGAYDCGGSGSGRSITSDAGAVYISVPVGSTSTEGLDVNVTKVGSAGTPIAGVSALHTTAYGVALVGEVTNAGNYYAGVQGFNSASNSTAGTYPTGVSGYFTGTNIGVGVWGETDANVAVAGTGAGVYGFGNGTKNYGGWFYSNSYPGLNVQTGSAAAPTAQIVSAGTSYINPAMLIMGLSQFDCSSATQHSIIINNLAGQPTIAPSAGHWGYLGTAAVAWNYLYYFNAVNASRRELKRDIHSFDQNLYSFAMDEIMQLKPSLYKYKDESDELISGQEAKTRYNYHLGLILDEAPDFLQDNAFSGIDIYALSTLNLAGIQYLNNEVENITSWAPVSDFGRGVVSATEVRINYSSVITGNEIEGIPVVSITPTSAGAKYYVKTEDKSGFTVVSENGPMSFNWVADARKMVADRNYNIPESTMSQLKVDPAKKLVMQNFGKKQQDEPLKLLGGEGDPKDNHNLRMRP
jgi:hypothetical protein